MSDAPAQTEIAGCARCGTAFVKRRSDHRFCTPECRKLGEWKQGDTPLPDPGAVARLFDESRDPAGPLRDDDWISPTYQGLERWREWLEIDGVDTVADQRSLYLLDHPHPDSAA